MKAEVIDVLKRLYNPVWRKKQNAKHIFRSEIQIEIEGRTFEFDISNQYSRDWFLPRYANGGPHEPELTSLLMDEFSEDTTFFDVGAHIGYFSGVAAALCEEVHSFEVNPSLIEIISKNIELNGNSGDHAVNCTAVSKDSGQFVGFELEISENYSTAAIRDQAMARVPTTSIDHYCTHTEVNPNIIKIDVEGKEVDVLQGAKQVLSRTTTEIVMVEAHPTLLDSNGQDPSELIRILESADYNCSILEHRGDQAILSSFSDLSEYRMPFYIVGQ